MLPASPFFLPQIGKPKSIEVARIRTGIFRYMKSAAAATNAPVGITVPSEKVNGLRALQFMETSWILRIHRELESHGL